MAGKSKGVRIEVHRRGSRPSKQQQHKPIVVSVAVSDAAVVDPAEGFQELGFSG